MKRIFNTILGFGSALLMLASCNFVLEEHPKTVFTPDYFTTPAGVEGGLAALYSHLRDQYGDPYTWADITASTDEATYSANGFKGSDMSTGAYITADDAPRRGWWNFTYVNTANGIIENATAAGMSESLIAEAKFFRAFYYFNMVRVFGGVPLDLGSGELKFNTQPVRTSYRNTVPEVYTAIFRDLEEAMPHIGDNPRVKGGITKTAVRILLSRAYLTYAWWLENPGQIPTYPAPKAETGLQDAKLAPGYFKKAYDLAVEGIKNPGPFGLESSYYKIHLGPNDYNKEQVFYADHTDKSPQYNGGTYGNDLQGSGPNYVFFFLQWNYPNVRAVDDKGNKIAPVTRVEDQFLGRPWERLAPTHEALSTFGDTTKDSRWDGTFSWMYRTNWHRVANLKNTQWVEGPHGNHIGVKEPFLAYYNHDIDGTTYVSDGNGFDLGKAAGYDHYVVDLNSISRFMYPALWKQGPYRTDTDAPEGIGFQNANSTRPYIIYKFSDLYFIAAEAAVKNPSVVTDSNYSAYNLINVIRARAGKWEYKNNEQKEYTADFSADLVAATPTTITIDFLLDEMLREYFGEGRRWFDLTRTQQWLERASSYTISPTKTAHDAQTFTRWIKKENYLTPVPQSQLDAMKMTPEEKEAYQTPGYYIEK